MFLGDFLKLFFEKLRHFQRKLPLKMLAERAKKYFTLV